MNFWKSLFHRHTYDPETWTRLGDVNVYGMSRDMPHKIIKEYQNTCLGCGKLVIIQHSNTAQI